MKSALGEVFVELKILLTCDLFPKFGTMYARYLGKNLVAKGHEVHVLTSTYIDHNKRSHVNEEVIDGILVHRIPSFHMKVFPYVVTPSAPLELAQTVKKYDIDIVNGLHLVHYTTWTAFLAKKLTEFPLVYSVLGPRLSFGESRIYKAKIIFEYSVARLALNACEAIIADCNASKESVTAIEVDETKISVIPDGVDTNKFHPLEKSQELCEKYRIATNDKVIAYVGSLTETKGPDVLLKALPRIRRKVPNVKLLVVGDGPLRVRLEHEARELGVGDIITFMGYRLHDELPNIMNLAHLGIVPSRSEGISLALLEFMACGKAVVATRVGGNTEVVQHNINGILVEPKNPSSLADGIIQALSQCRNEEMGKNARTLSLQYDWSVVASRISEVYHNLINNS